MRDDSEKKGRTGLWKDSYLDADCLAHLDIKTSWVNQMIRVVYDGGRESVCVPILFADGQQSCGSALVHTVYAIQIVGIKVESINLFWSVAFSPSLHSL